MSFLFDNEVRLFGLKRSGNAAIINFLFYLGDKRMYLHDHNTHLRITEKFKHFRRKKGPFCENYLNTIEQMDLQRFSEEFEAYNKERSEYVSEMKCDGFSRTQKNLILLRSPHNNLASLSRSGLKGRKKHVNNFVYLWSQYAREAVMETNYLGESKVVILFDKWFQSEDYRVYISSLLGHDYTDRTRKGINRVIRIGSSFDGKKYDGSAQEMKVLDRWEQRKEHSWFRDMLLGSKSVIGLTKKIFDIDLVELLG
jgi:hypothetical protein